MKRPGLPITAFVSLAFAACLLVGCGGPDVEFHVSDVEYTSPQTRLILERIDVSRLSDQPVGRATELRSSALANLRAQGEAAAKAADLITKTFPPGTRSVPVYVENATVDGRPSLVIVEAWESARGTLERKRLWVIERDTGDVVYSAAAK